MTGREREPAHDCDGTANCPAALRIDALHPPTCLGVYRTDAELAAGAVPSVSELRRRMRDEATVRSLIGRARARRLTNTYTANDIATALAERLGSGGVRMDSAWRGAVAGIVLAEPGAFTIGMENGQRFRVSVEEERTDG